MPSRFEAPSYPLAVRYGEGNGLNADRDCAIAAHIQQKPQVRPYIVPTAGFEPAAFCSGARTRQAPCSPAYSQVARERNRSSYPLARYGAGRRQLPLCLIRCQLRQRKDT